MTNKEIYALIEKMTVRQKAAQLLQLNANLLVVTDAEPSEKWKRFFAEQNVELVY